MKQTYKEKAMHEIYNGLVSMIKKLNNDTRCKDYLYALPAKAEPVGYNIKRTLSSEKIFDFDAEHDINVIDMFAIKLGNLDDDGYHLFHSVTNVVTVALVRITDQEKKMPSYLEIRLYIYKFQIDLGNSSNIQCALLSNDWRVRPDLFTFSEDDFLYDEVQYKTFGVAKVLATFGTYIDKQFKLTEKMIEMFDEQEASFTETKRIIEERTQHDLALATKIKAKAEIVLEEMNAGLDDGIKFDEGNRNNGKIII